MLRSSPEAEPKDAAPLETPPAPPPPLIQALDAIAYEERYKKGKAARLCGYKFEETPENLKRANGKVGLKEKLHIMATNTISSIGLGLGCTVGVLLKFIAPIAFGGAALTISINVLIALTGGAGLLALGLAFLAHRFYTKEAIKNAGITLCQIEDLPGQIERKKKEVIVYLQKSFTMLLQLQLVLEKFRRSNPNSSPSKKEEDIQKQIDAYINFLTHDATHPSLEKLDPISKTHEIEKITQRQETIRAKLSNASRLILNTDNPRAHKYPKLASKYTQEYWDQEQISDCFPSLDFNPTKPTVKFKDIIKKPHIGLTFLGTFSGTFGLSFLSITMMTAFTVIPMAFPPLYLILGLAFVAATYNGYRAYQTKKSDAERNAEKSYFHKQYSYYVDNRNTLGQIHENELKAYNDHAVRLAELLPRQDLSPKTPESSLPTSYHADFTTSSSQDLTSISLDERMQPSSSSQIIQAINPPTKSVDEKSVNVVTSEIPPSMEITGRDSPPLMTARSPRPSMSAESAMETLDERIEGQNRSLAIA